MDSTTRNVSINSLTEGYFSDHAAIDECFSGQNEPRESWKKLLSNIESLGAQELKGRQQELLKLLQENGVTYNVYGDTNGLNRPWLLDTIPLVISAAESALLHSSFNKLLEDQIGRAH